MARAKPDFNPDGDFKPGVHSTGHPNLYLLIAINGNNARSWTFRYQWQKKTRAIGLGATHTVSFAAAQAEALKLRIWLLHKKRPETRTGQREIRGHCQADIRPVRQGIPRRDVGSVEEPEARQ